jgi:hypothetical protein
MGRPRDRVLERSKANPNAPSPSLGGGGARRLAHGTTPRRGLGAIKDESQRSQPQSRGRGCEGTRPWDDPETESWSERVPEM